MTPRQPASYVLPLRWTRPGPVQELAGYLRRVAAQVDEVIVVDGSPPARRSATPARVLRRRYREGSSRLPPSARNPTSL